jgi:hypothetical protein
MKKILYLFIGFLFLINTSQAQQTQTNVGKPIIIKASYFDISPPLRDMVQNPNTKVDMTWKEGIVINKSNVYSNDSSIIFPFVEDPIRQSFFGQTLTDTTIQNYEGVGPSGYLPPDTDGDVGPNNYFQVVNVRFAVYDKNGNKLIGPLNNSSLFTGLPHNHNDGDAVVLYDQDADRWLFSQFSLPNYPNGPSYQMVAISQTGDPTGSWYRYQFTFTYDLPDYPKISVWKDAYYMSIRGITGSNLSCQIVAMDRASMIAGSPTASMVMLPIPAEGNLPADCDSDFPPDGTPCPVCYLTNGSSAAIHLYEFHVDWVNTSNSTLTLATTIPISPFSSWGWSFNTVPQKGTNVLVDAFSRKFIMFRMPFRKFSDHWSMLLNTTVKLDAPVHAGIRWMEVRNSGSGWNLYQESTYAPDSNWRWMGSIAMDTTGNITLGFSISSSNMYPSIRYTGRMHSDSLGVMTIAERGIINGGGCQTHSSGRWGDYSAMTADPTVFGKFWYTQEYYETTSSANWKTRIASFSFADIFNIFATATPNIICTGQSSQLNANATGGSGTYTYSWTSIPAGFTSTIPNPVANPTFTTKYIATVSDGSSTKTDTVTVYFNSPTANAGPDATYANTVPLLLVSGAASSYSSVKWLTSGDGYFNIDTVLSSLYYPGPIDRNNGGVDLTLQAYPLGPCTDTASDIVHITLTFPAGIGDNSSGVFGVTISPNPSNGMFTLVIHGIRNAEARITITDLAGKEIYSENGNASTSDLTKEINLAGYPKGTYFVKVLTNQHSTTNKLVLQ